MNKKSCIVDYGLGNLYSVDRALKWVGSESVISSDPEVIKRADRLVLPGVGAFGQAMQNLAEQNLIEALLDFVKSGRPFLGICLGMQLFMDSSEELGLHEGLKIIKGQVKRFPVLPAKFKVPHIGYCALEQTGVSWGNSLLDGLDIGEFVYFVHSFVVHPEDAWASVAYTNYGNHKYCAVVNKENVWGCQFHPEKSGKAGLHILHNFVHIL